MPVTVMTAPEKAAATVKSEPRSPAIARPDEDAEANRWSVYDRARWWRPVIVSPRRCAVRLHHIGTGARAWGNSKRECEHRQCCHYKFFVHDRYPLDCLG